VKTAAHIFVVILTMLALSSCRPPDEVVPPQPNKTVYIIQGKIMNGTTQEPKYPGMELDLVVQYVDIFDSEREVLGTCQIQKDGSFFVEYTHSKLLENASAKLNLQSSFYSSPLFAKNKNVDTVIYESSRGIIRINLIPTGYSVIDTLYVAGSQVDNEVWFDSFPMNKPIQLEYRNYSGDKNIVHRVNKSLLANFDQERKRFINLQPIYTHFTITGDPIIDELTVQLKP
jgi:hypothetical protein